MKKINIFMKLTVMFLNPLIFFISFAVGLFIVYILQPSPEIIYKYPTPENVHATIYKDLAENCYKYEAKEVTCTKDSKPTPVQHVDIAKKEKETIFGTLEKKYMNKK